MNQLDIDDNIALLKTWLITDPDARQWAVEKQASNPAAEKCEKARWGLTNEVLKPLSKKLGEQTAEERVNTLQTLENIVRVTLPFDRANACLIMKLNRDASDCPNGFMWISEPELAKIPQEKRPSFGGKVQCHSVANAYLTVAQKSETVRGYVNQMTESRVPKWMRDASLVPEDIIVF